MNPNDAIGIGQRIVRSLFFVFWDYNGPDVVGHHSPAISGQENIDVICCVLESKIHEFGKFPCLGDERNPMSMSNSNSNMKNRSPCKFARLTTGSKIHMLAKPTIRRLAFGCCFRNFSVSIAGFGYGKGTRTRILHRVVLGSRLLFLPGADKVWNSPNPLAVSYASKVQEQPKRF